MATSLRTNHSAVHSASRSNLAFALENDNLVGCHRPPVPSNEASTSNFCYVVLRRYFSGDQHRPVASSSVVLRNEKKSTKSVEASSSLVGGYFSSEQVLSNSVIAYVRTASSG